MAQVGLGSGSVTQVRVGMVSVGTVLVGIVRVVQNGCGKKTVIAIFIVLMYNLAVVGP